MKSGAYPRGELRVLWAPSLNILMAEIGKIMGEIGEIGKNGKKGF